MSVAPWTIIKLAMKKKSWSHTDILSNNKVCLKYCVLVFFNISLLMLNLFQFVFAFWKRRKWQFVVLRRMMFSNKVKNFCITAYFKFKSCKDVQKKFRRKYDFHDFPGKRGFLSSKLQDRFRTTRQRMRHQNLAGKRTLVLSRTPLHKSKEIALYRSAPSATFRTWSMFYEVLYTGCKYCCTY